MSAVSSVRGSVSGGDGGQGSSSGSGADIQIDAAPAPPSYSQKQIASHFNDKNIAREVFNFIPALAALYVILLQAPWAAGVPDEADPNLEMSRHVLGWMAIHVMVMYAFRAIAFAAKWPAGLMFADMKWHPMAISLFLLTAVVVLGFTFFKIKVYADKAKEDPELKEIMDKKKPHLLAGKGEEGKKKNDSKPGRGTDVAAGMGLSGRGDSQGGLQRPMVQQRNPMNIYGEPMPNVGAVAPPPAFNGGYSGVSAAYGGGAGGMSAYQSGGGYADHSSLFA